MDTEEDISAIYINLVDMVHAFTNLQLDFIFSIRNYCKKKKDIRNILLLRTNGKYKVVKRKPVVSDRSPNLFLYIETYSFISKIN